VFRGVFRSDEQTLGEDFSACCAPQHASLAAAAKGRAFEHALVAILATAALNHFCLRRTGETKGQL